MDAGPCSPPAAETASHIPDPRRLVPAFVSRHLHVGALPEALRRRYAEGNIEVWGATDPRQAAERLPPGCFDGVLINTIGPVAPGATTAADGWAGVLARLLAQDGLLALVATTEPPDEWVSSLCENAGLMPYDRLTTAVAGAQGSVAELFVRPGYNPIRHAGNLADAGRFDAAIQVLTNIPLALIEDEWLLAAIAVRKQTYYLQWQRRCTGEPSHSWFSKAQREFAQATAIDPSLAPAYRTQAEYWRHMGDEHTAERVWRVFLQSQRPTPAIPVMAGEPCAVKEPRPPAARIQVHRPPRTRRVLVIGHELSDYGMDTLYDGLCRVLGAQNVVEFPPKPMLHGRQPEATHNYPCAFDHPDPGLSPADILDRLQAGWFDLVLYADVVQMRHPDPVRRFVAAAAGLPLVVYDTWDDCYTPLGAVFEYIGRRSVALVFKREMLARVDYGPNVFPLPFGYPACKAPSRVVVSGRAHDVFWAGKREFGLRPLYVRRLEQLLQKSFDHKFDQAEYVRRLRSSLIGLSLCGYGFDTVRYWEVPANGGLLFAERPPIRIPCDFEDGVTAVFFEDLEQMDAKLADCLADPQRAAAIAAAGHQHWRAHHTSEARARQMLEVVERRCYG